MQFFYVFVLSAAVSLDAFAAGAAYGVRGIGVPLTSLAISGLVTVTDTALGIAGARLAGTFIPPREATVIGAALLVILGVFRLLVEYLEQDNPHPEIGGVGTRRLAISIGRLVIVIMAKPEVADLDRSKGIGPWEAVLLGLALSIDNVVAASAASLGTLLPAVTPLIMGVTQIGLFSAGCYGTMLLASDRTKRHLPYISGVVLVVLGLIRLI